MAAVFNDDFIANANCLPLSIITEKKLKSVNISDVNMKQTLHVYSKYVDIF